MPYYNRDPKKDHNFDNHPCGCLKAEACIRTGREGRGREEEGFTPLEDPPPCNSGIIGI